MTLADIPSPSHGVWHLGPLPIRAYALCIIVGVVVGVMIGERRWVARGGTSGRVTDVAFWAVPFGLVGGRLYHVVTTPQLYFGHDGRLVDVIYVWHGGLGIWGAVLLGGVGAWIACRRYRMSTAAYGDAIAPGIAVGQAIGRFGNYFNQELYGRPTHLPWALRIDGGDGRTAGLYHPTFLYESLWDLGVAGLLVWADRRYRLGGGRVFALYVAAYTAGRFWIELLRVDPADHVLGLRVNVWVAALVFAGAVVFLVATRGQQRETVVEFDREPAIAGDSAVDDSDGADGAGSAAEPGSAAAATGGPERAPPSPGAPAGAADRAAAAAATGGPDRLDVGESRPEDGKEATSG